VAKEARDVGDMTHLNSPTPPAVLPVPRTKAEAKRFYDRISRIYGWMTGAFERKHGEKALELLSIRDEETVLEVGVGSGHCLERMAEITRDEGNCYGVDISTGMLGVTRRRLVRSGLAASVGCCCADGANLPFKDSSCDAILMAFTLELFDTPEIPEVLREAKRVLRPGGRIAIASLSREGKPSKLMSLYEWAHRKWPRYADCRPIYAEKSLTGCGYIVANRRKARMAGMPLETVLAIKPQSTPVH
jgi:demethylmenaquinone methyltransferase/2-methoxy-6-polyprenyl-1,4-benzoquinol methylase